MKRGDRTPSLWIGGVESATAELPLGQGALPFAPAPVPVCNMGGCASPATWRGSGSRDALACDVCHFMYVRHAGPSSAIHTWKRGAR